MFTGLIAALGEISELQPDGEGAHLQVQTDLAQELAPGDSVAVNGVCLTATEVRPGGFRADAIAETLARTTLGRLGPGSPVNLELPLRADERLGGHIVQGHVDGTGTILSIRQAGSSRELTVEAEQRLMRYLVPKGSIAIDGVSLTISALDDGSFVVSLIPETLQRTTLGRAQEGDRVNLEVDILAKHVERLLGARA